LSHHSTKTFLVGQIRLSGIVVAVSIALSVGLVWLSVADLAKEFQTVSLAYAVIIPGTVAPLTMSYTVWQNLKNHRLHAEVRRLANRDDLTGLANRRCFTHKGAERLAAAGDVPLALILIDIDWFKQVNDRHGHEAGDAMLVHVAKTLKQSSPDDALIARLGGEEFTILCNVSDAPDLATIGESLRKSTEAASLLYRDEPIRVTISLGLAMARRDDNLSSLLSRADKALYGAKNDGRNRAALAD
jgi:diguanylate cyclase (GGDEF)-like protein